MANLRDEIKNKAETYKEMLQALSAKRQQWQDTTKQKLHTLLSDVAKDLNLDMESQVLDDIKNNESVNLCFHQSFSGYSSEPKGGESTSYRNYVKYGGALVFSLTATGNVAIWIIYSYIEEIGHKPESKYIVQSVSQDDLTDEYILKNVLLFLDEIIKWESNIKSSPIGFRAGKDSSYHTPQ